ncbi:restriction endonuclease subunit S [Diplocloster agilis]|uniref:restriction endonuclease subunit S n=1 Tax=Diplocloster agilis TaxID=2850323 RepID=UPI00082165B5|nr:restriction endonuclease subunit S [Suonthocola fibrivorans]MCU6732215.1 restriction endonuclease subunit S [Suonthocola fibrivorans]SCI37101.1 Type I restriction modification DNA specificity domain [uncultured Clostridium sp.]
MNRKNTPKLRFKEFEKADPWEQRKLGEISNKVTKKNQDAVVDEVFTNSAEFGIISQRDFFEKDIANAENIDGYYVVEPDDFVYNPRISATAPFGPIKRNKLERTGAMSPLYYVFRPYDIDLSYLEWYFQTTCWHSFMRFNGNSGARSDRFAITDKIFNEMPISMPQDIVEQKLIGTFLTKLESLITLHQRKYEKLKKVKNAYLDEMFPKNGERFPKRRFPGFTDPWEQRKLGEVSERVQGNDGRMDLPTLTISAANGWMSQEDRFSGNIAGKEQKNYTLLHKGELSYNHGNSKLAKYGTVFSLESYEEALVPRVYHSFRMIDADASFIEYYFSTKIPDRELAKLISSGARMDGLLNISFDEFMGIKINLPSIQEQQKISYYLRQLDNLITLHQRELDKLKKLKAAYLDAMFVGGK